MTSREINYYLSLFKIAEKKGEVKGGTLVLIWGEDRRGESIPIIWINEVDNILFLISPLCKNSEVFGGTCKCSTHDAVEIKLIAKI